MENSKSKSLPRGESPRMHFSFLSSVSVFDFTLSLFFIFAQLSFSASIHCEFISHFFLGLALFFCWNRFFMSESALRIINEFTRWDTKGPWVVESNVSRGVYMLYQ